MEWRRGLSRRFRKADVRSIRRYLTSDCQAGHCTVLPEVREEGTAHLAISYRWRSSGGDCPLMTLQQAALLLFYIEESLQTFHSVRFWFDRNYTSGLSLDTMGDWLSHGLEAYVRLKVVRIVDEPGDLARGWLGLERKVSRATGGLESVQPSSEGMSVGWESEDSIQFASYEISGRKSVSELVLWGLVNAIEFSDVLAMGFSSPRDGQILANFVENSRGALPSCFVLDESSRVEFLKGLLPDDCISRRETSSREGHDGLVDWSSAEGTDGYRWAWTERGTSAQFKVCRVSGSSFQSWTVADSTLPNDLLASCVCAYVYKSARVPPDIEFHAVPDGAYPCLGSVEDRRRSIKRERSRHRHSERALHTYELELERALWDAKPLGLALSSEINDLSELDARDITLTAGGVEGLYTEKETGLVGTLSTVGPVTAFLVEGSVAVTDSIVPADSSLGEWLKRASQQAEELVKELVKGPGGMNPSEVVRIAGRIAGPGWLHSLTVCGFGGRRILRAELSSRQESASSPDWSDDQSASCRTIVKGGSLRTLARQEVARRCTSVSVSRLLPGEFLPSGSRTSMESDVSVYLAPDIFSGVVGHKGTTGVSPIALLLSATDIPIEGLVLADRSQGRESAPSAKYVRDGGDILVAPTAPTLAVAGLSLLSATFVCCGLVGTPCALALISCLLHGASSRVRMLKWGKFGNFYLPATILELNATADRVVFAEVNRSLGPGQREGLFMQGPGSCYLFGNSGKYCTPGVLTCDTLLEGGWVFGVDGKGALCLAEEAAEGSNGLYARKLLSRKGLLLHCSPHSNGSIVEVVLPELYVGKVVGLVSGVD